MEIPRYNYAVDRKKVISYNICIFFLLGYNIYVIFERNDAVCSSDGSASSIFSTSSLASFLNSIETSLVADMNVGNIKEVLSIIM